jgi:hypothetical protein
MTFMPGVGNLPGLAQVTVAPGLLPADSLSSLRMAGFRTLDHRPVIGVGQSLPHLTAVPELQPLATCQRICALEQ